MIQRERRSKLSFFYGIDFSLIILISPWQRVFFTTSGLLELVRNLKEARSHSSRQNKKTPTNAMASPFDPACAALANRTNLRSLPTTEEVFCVSKYAAAFACSRRRRAKRGRAKRMRAHTRLLFTERLLLLHTHRRRVVPA